MVLRRLATVVSALLVFGSVGLVGCGDDDEKEPAEGQEHEPTSASCIEIMDGCHAADEGTGPAHDCHEVAHADVEADCAAEKDACLVACAM